LVSAEHHRGLSAGRVRALPVVGDQLGADAVERTVVGALEHRLAAYEVRLADQERRLTELQLHQRDELAGKDAELAVLRAEAERLRRGVIALAGRGEGADEV